MGVIGGSSHHDWPSAHQTAGKPRQDSGPACYFTIPSVELFEKQMEEAYEDFDVAHTDEVPVVFEPDFNLGYVRAQAGFGLGVCRESLRSCRR
jgi:hypothetical protein